MVNSLIKKLKKGRFLRRRDNLRSIKFYTIFIIAFGITSLEGLAQAPTVTLPTASGVTSNGATLGGTVTGALTNKGTRWSTTSPVGTSNELDEASTTSGAFTQNRTSLPPASKIFYLAYAKNGVDEGVSPESSFFTEPTQLSGGAFTVNATSESAITLGFPSADSWEGTGATGGYVIYRNIGSAPSIGLLSDGVAPPGGGDQIAIISDGTATSYNDMTLTSESDYFYTIIPFVWDGSVALTYNYNTTSPQTVNDFTFSITPTIHPTNGTFTVTGTSSSQINLAFDDPTALGNSDGYIILRRQDGTDPDITGVIDGIAPLSLAGSLPAGTTLVAATTGAITSFNDNVSLSPATRYRYLILPYNANASMDAGTYNYKTGGVPVTAKNDWTFATEPSGHATGSLTATPLNSTTIDISFNSITTSGITNAAGYIVLIKSTAIVDADLVGLNDGVIPNGFGLFKGIVNSTAQNTFSATGLSPTTTYHFALIPFNRITDDETYNYLTTTGFITGNATTTDVSAMFTEITGGTAPVIGSTVLTAGGTGLVLTGWRVTSDGSQVIDDIGFNYSGLSGQFNDEYLYRSTSAGTLGSQLLSDNSPDGNFSMASVSAGNKTINSTPVWYYLVVDVANDVTPVTSSVQVNPTAANINVASGIVQPFTVNRTFTFSTSQTSDIIWDAGTTDNINYRNFQSAGPLADNGSNSVNLGEFLIRDGGGTDGDDKPTNVTSVTIQVTNFANLRKIALFDDDGNARISGTEQAVASATIVFTPSSPIVVADDDVFRLEFRASFQSLVTDNQQIQITITGITANASGSGFGPIGTPSTTSDPAPTNRIAVNASKYIFPAPLPGDTPVNTPFALTVRAVDGNPHNNIDLDYNGQLDLLASGGSGTLTVGGGESLSPTLTAGSYSWTTLQIDQSGSYVLDVSDDAYNPSPDIGDASTSINISSSSSTVSQPAPLNLCYGGSFQTLGNIVITETDPSGFGTSGSFSLGLPTGFTFDVSVTTPATVSSATLSSPATLSYTGDNIVQFSYNMTSGSGNTNAITISGLKIRYPGSTAPSGGNLITRVGGTASIAGVPPGTTLGTVNAALGTPPGGLGFIVDELSGDVEVDPAETNFSSSGNAVRLVGSPAGGVFTGSGVTFVSGEYRFNPPSLSIGTYPITYTYTEGTGQQCQFTFTKTFTVYNSSITNLSNQYCTNDAQSGTLSVDPTFISTTYPAQSCPPFNLCNTNPFAFRRFVYWNPALAGGAQGGWHSITDPANNIFDPKAAAYQSVYASYSGIYIGFEVSNGPHAFGETFYYSYQFVTVKTAPTVTLNLPKNVFCADEIPITLIGNPANSDNTGDDFFTASGGQQAAVVSGGSPVTWSFTPALVSGVSPSTSVTFNLTYTFRSATTLCSNTSAPQVITVHARPSSVSAGSISPGVTQEFCQGTAINSFSATPVAGTTYKWYTDDPPTNIVGNGNIFNPPVDNTVPGTTDFFVTRTINGCESNLAPATPTTPLTLSVVVNASPVPPTPNFSNAIREYCVGGTINNTHLEVPGSNIKWYNSVGGLVYSGNTPSSTDLSLSTATAKTFTFNVTQTSNNCEGPPTTVTVTIKPLPVISISADSDPTKICTTGSKIIFSAFDQSDFGNPAINGTWSGAGLAGSLNPFPTFGTVELDPINLAPGAYNLKYDYTNSANCSNSKTIIINILPVITPSISIGDVCNGAPADIINNSTISAGSSTIESAEWVFGDGSVLPSGSYSSTIDPAIHSGNTTGTYENPMHLYPNVGTFQIQGRLTSSDGCVYSIPQQPVTVSALPVANFSWANVCQDTPTDFKATVSLPEAQIQSYNWDFATEGNLNPGIGSGKNTSFTYTQSGKDSAELTVTSVNGCLDKVKKPIYIVPPYPAITSTNSYAQSFDISTDNWISGGVNSSWESGTPAGSVIIGDASTSGDGSAWVTNLTGKNNINENSWVLSRCFDFSLAARPVISLDIWSDVPEGLDGAVLQYNEDGNIEDQAKWKVIGKVGEGINWYDDSGLVNSPGNQASGDLGWTGENNTWRTAVFGLDELVGKSNIVFRIAFASAQAKNEGFAFDNIFIGERSRIVLVENFTNSSSAANSGSHNNLFNNFPTAAATEVVKVQYHTAFPGEDPLNEQNKQLNNARSAFYGIISTKTYRVDGGTANSIGETQTLYNNRILTPSIINLAVSTVKDGPHVKINTVITNLGSQPLNLKEANIFTVIVEQSITDATLLGSSGNSEFKYVARNILPSPGGLLLNTIIPANGSYNVPEIIWDQNNLTTSGNSSIVVFVQSIASGDKSVYQTIRIDSPPEPDIVTGVENPTFLNNVSFFPNPVDHELTVQLPYSSQQDVQVKLADQVGKVVYENFIPAGKNSKTINTRNLTGGIYLLQIDNGKGNLAYRKVMVVHNK